MNSLGFADARRGASGRWEEPDALRAAARSVQAEVAFHRDEADGRARATSNVAGPFALTLVAISWGANHRRRRTAPSCNHRRSEQRVKKRGLPLHLIGFIRDLTGSRWAHPEEVVDRGEMVRCLTTRDPTRQVVSSSKLTDPFPPCHRRQQLVGCQRDPR